MTNPDSPALTDLIGLDPGFTGGLSADEYLRRQRCGECDEALTERDEARTELATVTEQRDHYLRSFKAQQAENERVHAKVREQYDVIEHAKKQRDEAIEQAKQAQAQAAVWWAGWEDGEWEGDGLYTDVEHAKSMSLACYLDAEVLPLDEHADGEDEDEAEVRKRREEVAVNLSWQAAGDNYCWRLNDTKHGWTGVALYRWKVDTRTCAEPVAAGGGDTPSIAVPPNSCQHDGIDKHDHAWRWVQGVGWHSWAEPSDELRKARMLARRDVAAGGEDGSGTADGEVPA